MRKVSIAPLFILLVVFLWTHLSHAQGLPTALPAKKKVVVKKNVYVVPPNTDVAVILPAKKKVASKKVVVPAAPGLAKTLPVKSKIVLDFELPVLPTAEAVVIRQDALADATTSSANEVEAIQHREILEAPTLEFVGPEQTAPIEITNQVPHQLRQALPDSDSFVALPANAKRAPQQPTVLIVQAPPVAAPSAGVAPSKPLPMWVPPAPPGAAVIAPVAVATPAPTPEPAPVAVAVEPTPPTDTISSTSIAPQLVTAAPVDPRPEPTPPPAVVTTTTVTETAIDTGRDVRAPIHTEAALQTTFLVPSGEIPQRRLFIRGGYLDAAYSKLESDLKNGATMMGFSASQVFSKTEVRIGFDVAHGLDQSITLRNTRMAMLRGEGLYTVAGVGEAADFYIGGALGIADIDVTSFRSQNANGDTTIRENAKGDALLAAPEIGTRIHLGRTLSFDVTAQYLLLLGGDQISSLGGLLGEAALGFRF